MWRFSFFATILLAAGPAFAADLPPGFVRLADVAPSIRQEMRYAGDNNFIGRPIAGYETADCWLLADAAAALGKAQEQAEDFGWRLVVYDCYRPERAVADFVTWSETPGEDEMKAVFYPDFDKGSLFGLGYIARRSQHSLGTTVDIGAEVFIEGQAQPLDFGTPFDFFSPKSATRADGISETARRNRAGLLFLLEAEGFRNYDAEWWHFTLRTNETPPAYDVPITE